jgi:hypothetical protein
MGYGRPVEPPPLLPGRACGSCTLCCKLLAIEALAKPAGTWCGHCKVGAGCGVYDARPAECRAFHCGYLIWEQAGEHWNPARSKMVIASEEGGRRVSVYVDPARPDAWRRDPFHRDIKQWAQWAVEGGQQVLVHAAGRAIAILPDQEVELGPIAKGDSFRLVERFEGGRRRYEAVRAGPGPD